MATIKIKVKPWVNKYLHFLYGNACKLSRKDSIGLLLYLLLLKDYRKKEYDSYLDQYTQDFEVEISSSQLFDRGTRYLSSFCTVWFNNFVEGIAKNEFHNYVDGAILHGAKQVDAIRDFKVKYGMTDADIEDDALKKSYQRYRQEQKKRSEINRAVCPVEITV